MKFYIAQILVFLSFTLNAQQILSDLENYKVSILDNHLTVITVETSRFEYINYKLIFDYNPYDEPQTGAVDFLIDYLGCNRSSETQFFTTKVSDTNAVDSMFRFIKHNIFEPVFDDAKITQTKKFEKQKILNQQNTLAEHEKIGKKFCFGENNALSRYAQNSDIDAINGRTLQSLYLNIIRPATTTIIAVGNVNHDTVVKYAKINFNSWAGNNDIKKTFQVNFPTKTIIHFKENINRNFASICYPIEYNFDEKNFFENKILSEIFRQQIYSNLSTLSKSIEYKSIAASISKFYLSFETSPENMYDAVIQSIETMRDLIIYPIPQDNINTAKSNISRKFTNSLVNPYQIAEYAYILHKYNLSNNFFSNFVKNINSVKTNTLNAVKKYFFKPDAASIFIQGNYDELICPLYQLAKFYRIYFYDKDFRKYKIIPQGFDCQYIIADYLKFCNATDNIKNLTIKFSVQYNADTIYNVKGVIYKKSPNLYYYKTELILPNDTLLQRLQIANNEVWLDSSALGAKYYKKEEFWLRIYQAYIFPEMYYKAIDYKPELICDTALMKQNKFKFKISTPYNFYIYDYYDFNLKQKYRTETIIPQGTHEDTVQIVEYSDYRSIKYGRIAHNTLDSTLMAKDLYGKTSDIKMPFTITQYVKNLKFIMKIDEIDDTKKINKKIFQFSKPQQNVEVTEIDDEEEPQSSDDK